MHTGKNSIYFQIINLGSGKNIPLTLSFIDYIETMLNQRDKNSIVNSTFINIMKAFDLVIHKILLDKLEQYGVKGQPLHLLKSYFCKRGIKAKSMGYLTLGQSHEIKLVLTPSFFTKPFQKYSTSNTT